IDNNGTISATASGLQGDAYGIHAYAYYYGDITISNGGSIDATATSAIGSATGIYATLTDGVLDIDSAGTITVQAGAAAYGINAIVDGDGGVTVTTGGSIDVTSDYTNAYGIVATTNGYGDVSVDNGSDLGVDGYLDAIGIHAYGTGTGSVHAGNSGTITVSSTDAYATGILGTSN